MLDVQRICVERLPSSTSSATPEKIVATDLNEAPSIGVWMETTGVAPTVVVTDCASAGVVAADEFALLSVLVAIDVVVALVDVREMAATEDPSCASAVATDRVFELVPDVEDVVMPFTAAVRAFAIVPV